MYDIRKKIDFLRKELHKHNHRYYVEDSPVLTDLEFDKGLIEDNLLSRDYVHYKAKYHGPPQYLPPYNHSTFLSHQVFLI